MKEVIGVLGVGGSGRRGENTREGFGGGGLREVLFLICSYAIITVEFRGLAAEGCATSSCLN